MRMINRTRKQGIKKGDQVTVSLLAARTKRAACWGDAFPGQLKEGHPSPSPWVWMLECFTTPGWGASGWGSVERAHPWASSVISILVDSEMPLRKPGIMMLDCSFLNPVLTEAGVMTQYNENDTVPACER